MFILSLWCILHKVFLFCFQASTNVRSFVTSNAKTKMETPSDIQSGKNTSLELATKKIVSGIKAWGIWSWNFLSVLKVFFFLSDLFWKASWLRLMILWWRILNSFERRRSPKDTSESSCPSCQTDWPNWRTG